MKGWVYILKCVDETYYTGSTNNILLRVQQHQSGIGSNFTAKRLPVELVYLMKYEDVSEAFRREKQIQGWSRRKKEALIKGDFALLKLFSVCYAEFLDALNGKNNRFQKHDIASIKGFQLFIDEDSIVAELLEYKSSQM